MRSNTRIVIVIKPVDRFLEAVRFVLVPLLAFFLSLPAIGLIFASRSIAYPARWIVPVIVIPLTAVYLVLVQKQVVGGRVNRTLMRLRRRIALACNHDYTSNHNKGGIACRLTPEEFQAPLFEYKYQEEIVGKLVQACREDQPGQYWFVQGPSGCGKTRTALRFVQTLARDRHLFELGCRCYLYDFNDPKSVQRRLPDELTDPGLEGSVVLVDNFQRVESEVLRELTRVLIGHANSLQTRLVVFFARPGEEWNLDPGYEVRLVSAAKEGGRHDSLGGPLVAAIEADVSRIDPAAAECIRKLEPESTASAMQLHLGQVIASNAAVPDEVFATLHLLGGQPENGTSVELVSLLGVLAALAVHRGKFSAAEFSAAAQDMERSTETDVDAAALEALLRRFHQVRLVSKRAMNDSTYLFHEDVARACVDRLWEMPAFRIAMDTVGRSVVEQQRDENEDLTAWLIATEIGNQDVMQETFEGALAKGANTRMMDCLRRAVKRYKSKSAASTRLQLAILLDRSGKFAESREELTDELVEELASSHDLAVLLAATRVESNHPANYDEADLEALLNHPEPLVRIIGEYWRAHINTHRGVFESDHILDLATRALPLVAEHEVFWQLHSLGRMHFDSLRAFYLEGRSDLEAIHCSARWSLDSYLKKRLPTYTAMHILYGQAHLVGHVLLPRLALLDEPVRVEDAAVAGLELSEPVKVSELTTWMLTLYRRAQDEFHQYGDREAIYLKADVVNAEMIQGDAALSSEDVEKALTQYRQFIMSSKFNSLNSYPHFYFLRWHILRYYGARRRGENDVLAGDELKAAEAELGHIVALASEAGNAYGEARARLLTVLVHGITDGFDTTELATLRKNMEKAGYGFEEDLLTRLIDRAGAIPAELEKIFRFYPFVQQ